MVTDASNSSPDLILDGVAGILAHQPLGILKSAPNPSLKQALPMPTTENGTGRPQPP